MKLKNGVTFGSDQQTLKQRMSKMRRFKNPFSVFVMLISLFLFMIMAPIPAHAGYERISGEQTLASGQSTMTITIPISRSQIRNVFVFVPTLDSGDTSTLALRIPEPIGGASNTYTPNGWSDKAVGATEDNAVIACNTTQLSIICDGTAKLIVTCATTQAAARTFKYAILLEN